MKRLLIAFFALFGSLAPLFGMPGGQTNGKLKIGDLIPAVVAKDQDGKTVNLAIAAQNGYTLVYFYPKALSPGCTAQACSLRDAYSDLQKKGVKIYGVSLDPIKRQKKFQEKESYARKIKKS